VGVEMTGLARRLQGLLEAYKRKAAEDHST
jgi:hypothetical protein